MRLPPPALVLAAALLGACSGPDTADTGPDLCPTEPPLTWTSFGQGHLEKHCNGCHGSLLPEEMRNGAPLDVNFDTLSGAILWAERIEARATGDEPTMPPGGGPSASEQEQLDEWLRCDLLPRAQEAAGG